MRIDMEDRPGIAGTATIADHMVPVEFAISYERFVDLYSLLAHCAEALSKISPTLLVRNRPD
jgi:hypothetical protein